MRSILLCPLEETADEWLIAGGAATHNTRRVRDRPPLGMLRETMTRRRVRGPPKPMGLNSEKNLDDDPGWKDIGWRQERVAQMQAKLLMAQRAAFAKGAAIKAQSDAEELSEQLHKVRRQADDIAVGDDAERATRENEEKKRAAFEAELKKANARVAALQEHRATADGASRLHRFRSSQHGIPSTSVNSLISDLMGSFGVMNPLEHEVVDTTRGDDFAADQITEAESKARDSKSILLYKKNKDSEMHRIQSTKGATDRASVYNKNFSAHAAETIMRFRKQATEKTGSGIPDLKTTIIIGLNASEAKCASGEFSAPEGFACHGEIGTKSLSSTNTDPETLYFYDRLSFAPDPREEGGWTQQSPSSPPRRL